MRKFLFAIVITFICVYITGCEPTIYLGNGEESPSSPPNNSTTLTVKTLAGCKYNTQKDCDYNDTPCYGAVQKMREINQGSDPIKFNVVKELYGKEDSNGNVISTSAITKDDVKYTGTDILMLHGHGDHEGRVLLNDLNNQWTLLNPSELVGCWYTTPKWVFLFSCSSLDEVHSGKNEWTKVFYNSSVHYIFGYRGEKECDYNIVQRFLEYAATGNRKNLLDAWEQANMDFSDAHWWYDDDDGAKWAALYRKNFEKEYWGSNSNSTTYDTSEICFKYNVNWSPTKSMNLLPKTVIQESTLPSYYSASVPLLSTGVTNVQIAGNIDLNRALTLPAYSPNLNVKSINPTPNLLTQYNIPVSNTSSLVTNSTTNATCYTKTNGTKLYSFDNNTVEVFPSGACILGSGQIQLASLIRYNAKNDYNRGTYNSYPTGSALYNLSSQQIYNYYMTGKIILLGPVPFRSIMSFDSFLKDYYNAQKIFKDPSSRTYVNLSNINAARGFAELFIEMTGGFPSDARLVDIENSYKQNSATGVNELVGYLFEYRHSYNGIPIVGPGGDAIKVFITKDGRVNYYFRYWHEITSPSGANIVATNIPTLSNFASIVSTSATHYIGALENGINITNVTPVYYVSAFNEPTQNVMSLAYKVTVNKNTNLYYEPNTFRLLKVQ